MQLAHFLPQSRQAARHLRKADSENTGSLGLEVASSSLFLSVFFLRDVWRRQSWAIAVPLAGICAGGAG
jgi:hypothetical protein